MKPTPRWRSSKFSVKDNLKHEANSRNRGGLKSAMAARPFAPITLPKINALTLAEIDAKYGRLR